MASNDEEVRRGTVETIFKDGSALVLFYTGPARVIDTKDLPKGLEIGDLVEVRFKTQVASVEKIV